MQAEQTLPHSQTVEETAANEDAKMSEEVPQNKEEVQHENIATPGKRWFKLSFENTLDWLSQIFDFKTTRLRTWFLLFILLVKSKQRLT